MKSDTFEIYDILINKLDTFPLDMQFHITNIQRLDNKIIRYNKKYENYFKKCLNLSSKEYFEKIKHINKCLKDFSKEREYSMKIVTNILKDVFNTMDSLISDDLKETVSVPFRNASILKTQLEKKDIPKNIKQPTYCVCKDPAYGDMIRCDGADCKILWFHFGCMKICNAPKTNWYCMNCRIKFH
ncbi:Chromatin remodeling protein, contains PHD Zn-finger [Pseudoloma neurophilia]|uniref:Chromatin remodeling protein, contains PHD Zn-finger n=1 Tax=Pseudoloma neurophilia TaxID=146866 RepID=A0A0R0LVA1_9MICR|nr:Chromatin remodeling protein, contains PHD Zn-finger [Pseudoloma neurophilia]